MLTSAVNNSTPADQNAKDLSSALNKSNFLDKDDFLKLFVEQLKHQDPLNPMENYEVASQLAQYSSLEQLVNINSAIKKFTDLSSMNSYFQGINLIGKKVEYEGNGIMFDPVKDKDGAAIKFKLNEETPEVHINIYDKDDNFVRSLTLDNPATGANSVIWDGKNSKGIEVAKGFYKYEIIGYNDKGKQVDYTPYGYGDVDSIRYDKEKSTAFVTINNDEVEISKISNIMN